MESASNILNLRKKTPRDVLRVVLRRRTLFLLSGAIFAIIVLAAAPMWEPEYTGTAKFERRADEAMAEKDGGFSEQRVLLQQEIFSRRAFEQVFEELALLRGLDHDEDGELTAVGQAQKQAMLKDFRERTTLSWEVRSNRVDRISVSFTHPDPELARDVPNILVNNYINRVTEVIKTQLTNSFDFLQEKVAASEARVGAIRVEKLQFEARHANSLPADAGQLGMQIEDLQATIEGLRRQKLRAEQMMESYNIRIGDRGMKDVGDPTADTQPTMYEEWVPNPEIAELQKELDTARENLSNATKVQRMTDNHPTVKLLRAQILQLENQLAVTEPYVLDRQIRGGKGRLNPELLDLLQRRAMTERELQAIDTDMTRAARKLAQLEELQGNYLPVRQEADRLNKKLEKAESELATWEGRLNNIQMQLAAEIAKHRTHLRNVEPAQKQVRPSSPKFSMILAMALGGGLACGIGMVFLANLMDRTLSTPEQARDEFRVPIMGIIDEIDTAANRRSRAVWRWLVWPSVSAVVVVVLGIAVLNVYLWLNRPELHRQWQADPIEFVQDFLDQPQAKS